MYVFYILWEPQRQSFAPLNFGSSVFLEISSVLHNRNQEIVLEGGDNKELFWNTKISVKQKKRLQW